MASTSADDITATGASARGPRSGDEADPGLVVLYAGDLALPSVFLLPHRVVMLGRAPPAEIVLSHSSVSRMHARITPTREGHVLRDLQSRNGVIVGGEKIDETLLQANDVVRVGDVLLKFVPEGASAYAPYRIDGTVEGNARRVTIPGAVGGFQIARVSAEVESAAATSFPVLIQGETGTGKELVARALHGFSARPGPLVSVNCAALPHNLVESELFGFKKGAFSGAHRDHPGFFRSAHGGTLFLDEIGDMPLAAQAKLLRTIETGEVQPLGGVQTERVDVRIVAATHRDLLREVDAGKFRGDLFARLNGFTITLPPLRARKEDLAMLVRHALREAGEPEREVTFRFMLAVCHYDWPFNVRELASAVRRAASIAAPGPLDVSDLPEALHKRMESYGRPRAAEPVERSEPTAPAIAASSRPARPSAEDLTDLLRTHRGNVAAVARALGKDRAQIHRWMHQLAIDPDSFR